MQHIEPSRSPAASVAPGSAMSPNLTPALPAPSRDARTAGPVADREARAAAEAALAAGRSAARAAASSAARAARLARDAEPVRMASKHHVLVRASHWAHVPLLIGLIVTGLA